MKIDSCKVLSLTRITDPRGNLTFIENSKHIPFDIKRVFYLYDVPGGEMRAGHALKKCHQLLVAVSGSFDVILDDGFGKKRIHLNRSYFGLHIPPAIWREIDNFSSGSVCLVLASESYSEEDYYRDYRQFIEVAKAPPLRAVEYSPAFLEKSWHWLNDPELRELTMTPDFTRDQQLKWFENLKNRNDYRAWGLESEGQPIGVFGLKNITLSTAEYWAFIGEKEYWGKGIGRWMCDEISRRAKVLGLKSIYGKISIHNERSFLAHQKLGFKTVGQEAKYYLVEKEIES